MAGPGWPDSSMAPCCSARCIRLALNDRGLSRAEARSRLALQHGKDALELLHQARSVSRRRHPRSAPVEGFRRPSVAAGTAGGVPPPGGGSRAAGAGYFLLRRRGRKESHAKAKDAKEEKAGSGALPGKTRPLSGLLCFLLCFLAFPSASSAPLREVLFFAIAGGRRSWGTQVRGQGQPEHL